MYCIFTCWRSPAYSSSICLIEENPEIIGQAVLKKKYIYLFVKYIYYLLDQKGFFLGIE